MQSDSCFLSGELGIGQHAFIFILFGRSFLTRTSTQEHAIPTNTVLLYDNLEKYTARHERTAIHRERQDDKSHIC